MEYQDYPRITKFDIHQGILILITNKLIYYELQREATDKSYRTPR